MAISALKSRLAAAFRPAHLTAAQKAFNTGLRTLQSLQTLAQHDAKSASVYLDRLSLQLKSRHVELTPEAKKALTTVAAASGGKLRKVLEQPTVQAGLSQIFDGRAVNAQGSGGWGSGQNNDVGNSILAGRLRVVSGNSGKVLQLTTRGGRTVRVVSGPSALGNMPLSWAQGFIERKIPLQFEGKFSADGSEFQAIGFAPATPKYAPFMFARGRHDGGFTLADGRQVQATHQKFLQTMKRLDQWGVILPGEPKWGRRGWSYGENPSSYWTLGRPQGPGRVVAAYNTFDGKVTGKASELKYLNHTGRNWIEGQFSKPNANNQFEVLKATTITGITDTMTLTPAYSPAGTPLQSLLYAIEVG